MKITISIYQGGLAEIDRRRPKGLSRSEFLRRCALGKKIVPPRRNDAARAYRHLIFSAAMAKNCIPYLCDYVSKIGQNHLLAAVALASELAAIDAALNSFFPHLPVESVTTTPNGQRLLHL